MVGRRCDVMLISLALLRAALVGRIPVDIPADVQPGDVAVDTADTMWQAGGDELDVADLQRVRGPADDLAVDDAAAGGQRAAPLEHHPHIDRRGVDQRRLGVEAIDRRVVGGRAADEDRRIARRGEGPEQRDQEAGGVLGGAARARGELGQADRLLGIERHRFVGHHMKAGVDLRAYTKDPSAFDVADGMVCVSDKPGLGIEIDEEAVRAAAVNAPAWQQPYFIDPISGELREW